MDATIDIRTADGNVNILLEDKQVGQLREVLVDLCLSTMAVFSMLIDAAGRVVATGGETAEFELEAIAALAAGDLATSRQLAAMLNEPEFSLLFQHEKQKNMFLTAIESDAILIVVFDVDTTFGALRLRIRRSISQLQQILHQAKRNTVIALSATNEVSSVENMHTTAADEISAVPEPPPPALPAPPASAASAAAAAVSAPVPAAPVAAAPAGLPDPLAGEIRKALAWFETYQGWKLVFHDEIEFLSRGVERNRADEAETMRSIFLRTRARLTEQKRLLEARFRLIQSLYQQFVVALQLVMQGAWHDDVVDRAMKAAFSGVGADHNLVGTGVGKTGGNWGFDFGLIGKQLVTVCHARGWNYHQGMLEVLRQLNAALSALSAFVIEDARLREELTKSWARLYRHYSDGLKTLELEPEVLDLFRPLVKSGAMPK